MKKVKKLIFAAILSLSAVVLLVACKAKVNAEDLLKNFLLQEDNTEVNKNFSVQSKLQHGEDTYPLVWTSNKENLVVSSEENTDNSTYDVTVVRPESETVEVTLTVTLTIKKNNEASKDFKVRISPVDVYDFSGTFKLAQKGTVVYNDFELPTTHSVGNKTCSITWSSANESLIKIENNMAKVTATTIEAPTKLFAEFSYNNKTTKMEYPLTVYYPMTPEDALIYWYEHTGITQTLEGYVVAKGTYADNYGEGSLYVMDPTFKGGYYVYQAYIDKAEFDALELGTYVKCTGATNTNYNGLMETNYGGTLTVDKTKDKINVEDKRYAMDNDLIANVNSLYYRLSTPVSLTNWKITEIKKPDAAGSSTQTIVKLEKFGVKTSITYSKYFGTTPLDASNDTFKAVVAKLDSLKVGDWISVNGILGYYNKDKVAFNQASYQIAVTGADSIIAGTEDTATTSLASKVKDQIAAVNKAMENHTAIYEESEITLPTSSDSDVSLVWGFANDYHAVAEIKDGKLIVKPGMASNIFLTATFKNGDYETTIRFTILVEDVDSQEKVDREIKNLELEEEVYTGETTLPTTGTTHKEVKFTYELVGEYDGIKLEGNKLTLPAVTKEVEITLKVTGTLGDKTNSKEVVIYLVAPKKLDSIKAVVAENSGVAVEFTGTVVAVYQKGYVLYDGTAAIYVDSADSTYKVNDVVKVTGIWGYYKTTASRVRISKVISSEVVADATPATKPEAAKDYDLAALKDYIALKKLSVEYASFTGKVYVNGNYVNIIIDGSEEKEKVQGSLTFLKDEDKDAIKALDGVRVKFTGWLYDASGNYPYIIMEKYDIVDTIDDEFAVKFIQSGLEALAKTSINKDFDLPTTFAVPTYEKTVTLSWKNGEDAIEKIVYDKPDDNTPVNLTVTIKAGDKEVADVKITFTKAAYITDITEKVTIENGVVTIPYGALVAGAMKYVITVDKNKTIEINVSDMVITENYKEFGLPKNSNLVVTGKGVTLYGLISDVYGTYDNMKLYSGVDATGTAVNHNGKETSSFKNGQKFVYAIADGTNNICFDNSSNFKVDFYQLALIIDKTALPEAPVKPDPSNVVECDTIAKVYEQVADTTVQVTGTVVLATDKCYILWDGTTAVYVDHANTHAVNDVVKVTGKWSYYKNDNRVRILEVSESEAVSGATPSAAPTTATEYNLAALKQYIALDKVSVVYASYTGVVTVSGNFINIVIDGSEAGEVVQGSLSFVQAADKTAITALAGSKVKFTGWLYDQSSSKFPYLYMTKYEVLEQPTTPENPDTPAEVTADATVSFEADTNRKSFSTTQQVWVDNADWETHPENTKVTVTNDKGASKTDCNNAVGPVRFYQNCDLTIEATQNIKAVVFHYAFTDKMPTELTLEGCTITIDATNKTCTIVLNTPATSLKISNLAKQWRVNSIDIDFAE